MLEDLARRQSKATALEAVCCLMMALRKLGKPKSLVDIGCGDGHLVRVAAALGVQSTGVDIGHRPGPHPGPGYVLFGADLAKHWEWTKGDMVLCWEVAEHLPPVSADVLCKTIKSAAESDGWVLFSAATPGQGGAGHINEQPHEYWRAKLEALGLRYDGQVTEVLRWQFSEVAPAAWWYGKNVMGFKS